MSEPSKVILSYPGSNQNVRAAARALDRAGMLHMLCTTFAWRSDSWLASSLPRSLAAELRRRHFPGVAMERIARFPQRELLRLITERLELSAFLQGRGWNSAYHVSEDIDRRVAALVRRGADATAVYGYEFAARHTFEAAAERGLRRFYELTIGYWRYARRLFEDERQRRPEWAMTIATLRDTAAQHAHKDAELALADHIIVPSDFVKSTLTEHPSITASIDVVPYGAPPPVGAPRRPRAHTQKLRLLYVGHLSQRKGVAYLFDAMRQLEGLATLTLIGLKPAVRCPALDTELARHRWLGTVTHERVLEIMAEHDIFVFPSLFEGFGLVILEAMAQGLPVITTPNSAGGPMVVDDGVNGFIVPIRDSDAIAERVVRLARDPALLEQFQQRAAATALIESWAKYERSFVNTVRRRLSS